MEHRLIKPYLTSILTTYRLTTDTIAKCQAVSFHKMKRIEYINTRRGQSYEYLKRYSDRISISILQEPKSKDGIRIADKIDFRNQINSKLKELNRRAFRKDIVLQIDFQTTANNPPSVQNLVKNYLDLLHKEMPEIDNKKWLLFKDDDQVKVLIANIYFNEDGSKTPEIKIQAYRYNHFINDIQLVERIKYDRFEEDDFYDDDFKKPTKEDLVNEIDLFEDFEFDVDPEDSIKRYGYDLANILKEYKVRKRQQLRLKMNSLTVDDILNLIETDKRKGLYSMMFEKWNKTFKNFIFVIKDSIEIGESPTEKGQKKLLKERTKSLLEQFKKNNSDLVPLYTPIGITVLFTPPVNNILDLDNLTRYILPILNEIFKPPTLYDHIKYTSKYAKEISDQITFSQNVPKYGVMKYQVIKLDREDNSPKNGTISLFITDGLVLSNNAWWKVDSYIWDWKL